jgi:hypothetical protein
MLKKIYLKKATTVFHYSHNRCPVMNIKVVESVLKSFIMYFRIYCIYAEYAYTKSYSCYLFFPLLKHLSLPSPFLQERPDKFSVDCM